MRATCCMGSCLAIRAASEHQSYASTPTFELWCSTLTCTICGPGCERDGRLLGCDGSLSLAVTCAPARGKSIRCARCHTAQARTCPVARSDPLPVCLPGVESTTRAASFPVGADAAGEDSRRRSEPADPAAVHRP
eukprot:356177-Chlamydomonas_euryale.AAC.10